MNCKYCGAGLPTKGMICPECGRTIPMDQIVQRKNNIDQNWNRYRNKDTAFYKKEQAHDSDARTGKVIVLFFIILLILLVIVIVKGMG